MSVKSTSPNIQSPKSSSSSIPLNLTSQSNLKVNRPETSQNPMIHTCSWCEATSSNLGDLQNSFIQTHNHDKSSSSTDKIVFCSERCFESSRRASFKRGKTCDWCGDMTNNNKLTNDSSSSSHKSSSSTSEPNISPSTNSDAQQTKISLDRLQFCTEACLTNYKQNIFERETSVVLFNPKSSKETQDNHVHKKPIKNVSNKANVQLSAFKVTNRKSKINKSTKRILGNHFHNSSSNNTNNIANRFSSQNNNSIHNSINKHHFPQKFTDFISNNPNVLTSIAQPQITNNKPHQDPKLPFPSLLSPPVYIPIPIPVPIPIFKNAPEILEILHKFGYQPTKPSGELSPRTTQNPNPTNPLMTNNTKKPLNEMHEKSSKVYDDDGENNCEPQNEALDLTKTFSNPTNICHPQNNPLNQQPSALSLASILQLNDPYLKRRNRILDAPIGLKDLSGNSSTASHMKNYCFSYLSESINKNNNNNIINNNNNKHDNNNNSTRNTNSILKHLKRRIERHNNVSNSSTSTSNFIGKYGSLRSKLATKNHSNNNFPQNNTQTYNTTLKVSNSTTPSNFLRRYPLLSMRRNIKSAPSSMFNSNSSSTAKK